MGTEPFLAQGTFSLGCNYWASHAGTNMWRRWDSATVESDLALLASRELRVIRVFPLWPDFQPIVALRGGRGQVRGFASVAAGSAGPEKILGPTADGLDPEMLLRLTQLADVALGNNLRLIVALVTGWMSGRLYVPGALEGCNPLTDAAAVQWEIRLVRGIVRRLREHPAVAAWELGNECNVMGEATAAQSWTWSAGIADAIRSVDPSRPVLSGMHGLSTDERAAWSIVSQGENTDLLTTHPYPLFTPHCAREALHAVRPTLHAAAESCLYCDLGSRPAFAEELGSLGPAVAGNEVEAAHARAVAFSLWAHDCRAALWWCAFDFGHLDHAPYEMEPVERELGLFRRNGEAKPVLEAMEQVRLAVTRTGIGALPPRAVQAACVLPRCGNSWGAAFSTFILALQAGFDVRFVSDGAPLPDVPLYIVPSARFGAPLARSTWHRIVARVERGASLYLSLDDGVVTELEEVFGVRVLSRGQRVTEEVRLLPGEGEVRFSLGSGTGYDLAPTRAEVLGGSAKRPVFTRSILGQGRAYLLCFPLESWAAEMPGAFERGEPGALWRIYRELSIGARSGRIVDKQSAALGVTEHPVASDYAYVVLINYGFAENTEIVGLGDGWRLQETLYGNAGEASDGGVRVRIPSHDAAVLGLGR